MHKILIYLHFFFAVALQPNAGHGLLILEVFYITHNDTPQSVGLLWTSDQARRRDLYLTTHNTHNRQTSMPPVGFESTISAGERPQTYSLDRAATGTGYVFTYNTFIKILFIFRALPCSYSGGLRRNCIYAASGIVTLCRWLSCAPVNRCTGQSPVQSDDTRGCIYAITT